MLIDVCSCKEAVGCRHDGSAGSLEAGLEEICCSLHRNNVWKTHAQDFGWMEMIGCSGHGCSATIVVQ